MLSKYGDVIIAAFVFAGVYYSRSTKKNTDEINDAVNHRHRKAPDANGQPQPRLFDAVLENRRSVNHMRGHILELHGDVSKLGDKLDVYAAKLDAHMIADAEAHRDLVDRFNVINERLASRRRWTQAPTGGRRRTAPTTPAA